MKEEDESIMVPMFVDIFFAMVYSEILFVAYGLLTENNIPLVRHGKLSLIMIGLTPWYDKVF